MASEVPTNELNALVVTSELPLFKRVFTLEPLYMVLHVAVYLILKVD